ncbi:NADP-dependent malic enzyme-like [Onthophagus taurus]|uniref:NADP-dependent malic enzyme-like n=1 Tax=Onthophagus taurus TaxID=166361 RepID=UPI000C20A97A|nr:NADP-dependent malic enzyme-like [Onthophagus taurus]
MFFQKLKPSRIIKFLKNFHHNDAVCPSTLSGMDYLTDPRLNKGLAFTLEERQILGIHGLQPARVKTQEEQIELCKISLSRYTDSLNKYLYLNNLHERNERNFYRLISENIEQILPIVYTPTIGLVCQKFGLVYRRPKGLFITIHDKGYIYQVLKNWPENDVKLICVTDGERILGLGDLGASGMGIAIGKLSVCTALAGVDPSICLPIALDVGTNNETQLNDPIYVGLREKRISGSLYDEFLDEFMAAVVKKYGQYTLVQFEDFGNKNAFRLLDKYKKKYCTFNDDIQGTGAVVVSGFMTSERVTKKSMKNCNYLFFGAGEASIGIANLTVRALEKQGLNYKEACDKIFLFDIDGLITINRDLDEHKKKFAKNLPKTRNLMELIETIKPDFLIGASTVSGAFTPEILQKLARIHKRPVIFALSNPTHLTECTPEEALKHTNGQALIATGSPFPKFSFNGATFKPSQSNNAYIFPGMALGIIETQLKHIEDDLFLVAAETLSNHVTDEDLQFGSLYPPLTKIKEISLRIATNIMKYSFKKGYSGLYPEPDDKESFIRSKLYDYFYKPSLPSQWSWPQQSGKPKVLL